MLLKKIKICSLIFLAQFFCIFNEVNANTLDEIKERGFINCGVSEEFIGFAAPNDSGNWSGFDVDLCKALSVAIFNDANKVNFIPTNSRSRFPLLALKEIDVLIRNTTWSFSRDVNLEFEFAGINFYDGQVFMVPKSLDIKSIDELDGATICVVSGTSNELNTQYYFEKNNMNYKSLPFETFQQCQDNYIEGKCDSYTGDLTVLATSRVDMPDSFNHVILPEMISKEPLGPVVRQGDNHWSDLVRWTLNVLIIAEEKNLDSKNIEEKLISGDAETLRLLGKIGNYGDMLELDNDWAYNIINEIGNYSTIYEKNVGINSVLGLKRGMNALWFNGGLLYAPPYR